MAKHRGKLRKPAAEACQALGAFEAAAVMGVHFSTPARMVAKGLIAGRQVPSSGTLKSIGIFDGRSCEENFQDYEQVVAEQGGTGRRPRAGLGLRPDALRHLRAVETPIAFDDAITTAEAAELLSVHQSFIARMIARGEIVGRRVWSQRASSERFLIVSRKSCVANVQKIRKLQASGAKVGRPRKFS